MLCKEYFNRPNNLTYHNLCVKKKPPDGIGTTLGLGLKFCIQSEKIPANLNLSFERFSSNVRKRYEFCANPGLPPLKDKLYIKSTWVLPEADGYLEERIDKFVSAVDFDYKFLRQNLKQSSNLSSIQKNHINFLHSNRDFIILMADKNLGPAIMEREEYMKSFLREHLLQSDTYVQLTESQALNKIKNLREKANKTVMDGFRNQKGIGEMVVQYFKHSFAANVRIPQAYGMPKVHKKKSPVPFWPVVSQCGSVSATISTYVDVALQPFTQFIPSYIKNSEALLKILDNLPQPLPPNAHLFTSDATSMYTNIDPEEGIPVLKNYLNTFLQELKINLFPTEVVMELLEMVMNNNIFKFGSTWWLQKIGTAMGTPCACIYATMFFAYFECSIINVKYKNNFILYKRQIDDIFAIWINDPENPNAWENFNEDLNGLCKLEWNTEALSKSVNFLDLTIWIDEENRIKYKTFQKDMNLFLYLPAHSAHPPGVTKSLIFGLLSTYFRQNSDKKDFERNTALLFNRMLNRGHKAEEIRDIFLDAARKIDEKRKRKLIGPTRKKDDSNNLGQQLFFHLTYHPRSLSRKKIQENYNKYCTTPDRRGESFRSMKNEATGGVMKISKLTVAYGRPKNLRDILSPTKLLEFEDCKVQDFIEKSMA